jgi:hypothetical protein
MMIMTEEDRGDRGCSSGEQRPKQPIQQRQQQRRLSDGSSMLSASSFHLSTTTRRQASHPHRNTLVPILTLSQPQPHRHCHRHHHHHNDEQQQQHLLISPELTSSSSSSSSPSSSPFVAFSSIPEDREVILPPPAAALVRSKVFSSFPLSSRRMMVSARSHQGRRLDPLDLHYFSKGGSSGSDSGNGGSKRVSNGIKETPQAMTKDLTTLDNDVAIAVSRFRGEYAAHDVKESIMAPLLSPPTHSSTANNPAMVDEAAAKTHEMVVGAATEMTAIDTFHLRFNRCDSSELPNLRRLRGNHPIIITEDDDDDDSDRQPNAEGDHPPGGKMLCLTGADASNASPPTSSPPSSSKHESRRPYDLLRDFAGASSWWHYSHYCPSSELMRTTTSIMVSCSRPFNPAASTPALSCKT